MPDPGALPDWGSILNSSPGAQGTAPPVYQGGAIAPIRQVAEALGANVDWDPNTGRVSVNGRNVPWASSLNGRTTGSVHDIAAAAGGRVERAPDGSYKVYKPALPARPQAGAAGTGAPGAWHAPGTPGGGTPVTGNPTPAPPAGGGQVVALGGNMPVRGNEDYLNPHQPLPQAPAPGAAPQAPAQVDPVSGRPAPPRQPQNVKAVDRQVDGNGNVVITWQFPNGQRTITAASPAEVQALYQGGHLKPEELAALTLRPLLPPPPSDKDQPIDYNALQQRAGAEAQMWAAPQLQALKDLADRYQQQYENQRGYVNQNLTDRVADLRAGEGAREQRLDELMNRRGDAIYGSGVHIAARQGLANEFTRQEGRLSLKAQNALQKLSDSLGLRLQDVGSRMTALAGRQADKAMLTLQQLADKAQTRQFENRKLAWQMWLGGARLTMDQQKMANEMWLGAQRIKGENARADAERNLRLAIAQGNLTQKYAEMQQRHDEFRQRLTFDQEREADRQQVDQLKLALDAEKFDWDKQKFIISERNKVDYQNQLLALRQAGLIEDQRYHQATEEIRRGELSVSSARLLETQRHNQVDEGIQAERARNTEGNAGNSAWKSALNELQNLYTGTPMQNMGAAQAIYRKWAPQMSQGDRDALDSYFRSQGWPVPQGVSAALPASAAPAGGDTSWAAVQTQLSAARTADEAKSVGARYWSRMTAADRDQMEQWFKNRGWK